MSQLHKRLTDDQGRAFFQSYCQGVLSRTEIAEEATGVLEWDFLQGIFLPYR